MKKRLFNKKWKNVYFVTQIGNKINCLICLQCISVPIEYNVCRHYDMLHQEQFDALSGKICEEKVQQLKAPFAQQNFLHVLINPAKIL